MEIKYEFETAGHMVGELENRLREYDKIIWVEDVPGIPEHLTEKLLALKLSADDKKSTLILSTEPMNDKKNDNIRCQIISPEQQEELRRLYFLYDFSDRFVRLSADERYGGLLNYVDTGILTLPELFEVLG